MDRLTDKEVLHVADLARLSLDENEINDYAYKLKSVMNSIEKINDVEVVSDLMMISPSDMECVLFSDDQEDILDKKDVLVNAPSKVDSYISVRGVFDE